MDRFRGERFGDGGGRHSRQPSRWSDGPTGDQQHRYQEARDGGGGGADGFSGGRHHPYRRGSFDRPSARGGGGRNPGFRPGPGGSFDSFSDYPSPTGATRHGTGGVFMGSDRGRSPDNFDGTKFTKLFVGSVPRTATEQEIRPFFEEHGHVIEVALIKDKRTGQQQGCCFIKYATQEEADRAIRALHNQVTLPGGMGPIQVRYADGERERLGAIEHKLFVGSLNKQASEKEVEEIFSQYGRVEDVYLMRDELKQSRGSGFVKFSSREMALAAINGLNGKYLMRGCEHPLIVRFADPKRPRPGESRGPSFGGPGFNTRPQGSSGGRFIGEPMTGQSPDGWHFDKDSVELSSPRHFHNQFQPIGGFSVASSVSGFSPGNIQSSSQQMSPQQKQQSTQHLPTALQLQQNNQQIMTPYLQGPGHLPHLQVSLSSAFPSMTQPPPSGQLLSSGAMLPSSQPLLPQGMSALQSTVNVQGAGGSTNQQQLPGLSISQLLQQPIQQIPSQMALQQHGQALQSGLQPSQQTLSQLQQQLQLNNSLSLSQQHLQLLQPSSLGLQQNTQNVKEQLISATTVAASAIVPSATSPSQLSGQGAAPVTCNWTEHTSPQGFKYYYNSLTKESRWEKPEELTIFEQQQKLQQQQQNHAIQSQPQMPAMSEGQLSQQQLSQMQHVQGQIQLRQQGQLQHLHPLSYQASGFATNQNIQELNYSHLQGAGPGFEPSQLHKGSHAPQDWMWRNKT